MATMKKITSYTGNELLLSLPTTQDNIRVATIGTNAFSTHTGQTDLLEEVIGISILNIESSAFANCVTLQRAYFPLCTSISSYAFMGCTRFYGHRNLKWAQNCNDIGYGAFAYTNFETFSTRFGKTMFGSQIVNLGDALLYSGGSSLFAYAVASNNYEFECSECTSVYPLAFAGASNLYTISLPNCSAVYFEAFEACEQLSSIILSNCEYVGDYAFYGCSNLSTVELGNVYTFPCSYLGQYTFYNCPGLESISIFASDTFSICKGAFYQCSNLNNLYIKNDYDNGDITIDTYAFYQCTNLSSFNINVSNYTINSQAFRGCSISYLNLQGYGTIKTYGCYSMPSLRVADLGSCEYIENYGFYGCTNLSTVYLRNEYSVCSLANNAAYVFYNTNITSIYVPSNLLTTYRNNSYWNYYSNRIRAIPEGE